MCNFFTIIKERSGVLYGVTENYRIDLLIRLQINKDAYNAAAQHVQLSKYILNHLK